MVNLFTLLFWVSVVALIVGLIKPQLVVVWGYRRHENRRSVLKVYGSAMIVFLVLVIITNTPNNNEEVNMVGETIEASTKTVYKGDVETKVKKDDEETLEELKSKFDINLDWRDVEYDIINKKGNQFFIIGTGSLSSYYNYGYSNRGINEGFEKEYFSVSVTPSAVNSQTSRSWHIYLSREEFKDLFEDLKGGDVVLMGIAELSNDYYMDGQGNLAIGVSFDGY